jgi:hypothetical protein
MRIVKTLYRRYVGSAQFESTIAFYENLQTMKTERRLSFPERGIEVAVIGAFIVLAGTDDALAPVRHVDATLIVDSLDEFARQLHSLGAHVPTEFHTTQTGRNMTVSHPDGFVVEYFEPTRQEHN